MLCPNLMRNYAFGQLEMSFHQTLRGACKYFSWGLELSNKFGNITVFSLNNYQVDIQVCASLHSSRSYWFSSSELNLWRQSHLMRKKDIISSFFWFNYNFRKLNNRFFWILHLRGLSAKDKAVNSIIDSVGDVINFALWALRIGDHRLADLWRNHYYFGLELSLSGHPFLGNEYFLSWNVYAEGLSDDVDAIRFL